MAQTPPEQKRLLLRETSVLVKRLEAEGYKARARYSGSVVYAWGKDDAFACSFFWVKGKGWRFDVAQPFILTHADIDFAIDELNSSQKAIRAAWKAWSMFKLKKSLRRWREYQGVFASHNFRLFKGDDDGE